MSALTTGFLAFTILNLYSIQVVISDNISDWDNIKIEDDLFNDDHINSIFSSLNKQDKVKLLLLATLLRSGNFVDDEEDSQQIEDAEEVSTMEPAIAKYRNINKLDFTTTKPEIISVESLVEMTSEILTPPPPITEFESDANTVKNLETDENISDSGENNSEINNNNNPIIISIHKPNATTEVENDETNDADESNQINETVTESNSSKLDYRFDKPSSIELTSATENSNTLAPNLDRYKTDDGPESSTLTLEPYTDIENDSEPSSPKITEHKSSPSKANLTEITQLTKTSADFVTETENNETEDIAEPNAQTIDHSDTTHENRRSDPTTTEPNGLISEPNLFGLTTPATKNSANLIEITTNNVVNSAPTPNTETKETSFDIITNSDTRNPIVTEPNTQTTESPSPELIEQIPENSTNLPSKIENSDVDSVSPRIIIGILEPPSNILSNPKITDTSSATTESYLTEATTPTENLTKLDMNTVNPTENLSESIGNELQVIQQSEITSDNKLSFNLTEIKLDNSETNIVNWLFLANQSVKKPMSESHKLIMVLMMTHDS